MNDVQEKRNVILGHKVRESCILVHDLLIAKHALHGVDAQLL